MDLGRVSGKGIVRKLVVRLHTVVIISWHWLKDHAGRRAGPVELLLCELVTVCVANALTNIVVARLSRDPAPEEQLFEVCGC